MVATKTCSGCGWVYPLLYQDNFCKFCRTRFPKNFCIVCGEYTKMYDGRLCAKCTSRRNFSYSTIESKRIDNRRFLQRKRDAYEASFNEWLSMIDRVRKPLHTLTNDEWISACKHFGGCATCGGHTIDARGMFVPFGFGGRYAAWNIIPVCEECATSLKRRQNPFVRYEETVDGIVKYLRPILEGVIDDEEDIQVPVETY